MDTIRSEYLYFYNDHKCRNTQTRIYHSTWNIIGYDRECIGSRFGFGWFYAHHRKATYPEWDGCGERWGID